VIFELVRIGIRIRTLGQACVMLRIPGSCPTSLANLFLGYGRTILGSSADQVPRVETEGRNE
jgi:hypothetical protein